MEGGCKGELESIFKGESLGKGVMTKEMVHDITKKNGDTNLIYTTGWPA
jgi:F0F1-type ATP synthase beta subunit